MIRIISIVLLTVLMAACSSSPFYHKVFMRGQVVGGDDDQVVFCIGKETGASIGEEFVAYRYTYEDYYDDGDEEKETSDKVSSSRRSLFCLLSHSGHSEGNES